MEFNDLINAYHVRINDALNRYLVGLPIQSHTLVNAMRYGVLLGGKRLRPILVYATGNMLGANPRSLDAPAAAVECIHAYSLIHDDLPAMDNDQLRRGQPTCHVKYGEDTAILAGDALQTLAFSILLDSALPDVSSETRIEMLSELARASGVAGMCGGQALDLAAEGKQITLTELEQIHRHKTGELISASVRLGALCAGEEGKAALPILDRYANAIGLAYQVQDDILDVTGDTATLGKCQGADQALAKSTYPALMGLDCARTKAWDLYQESLAALDTLASESLNTAPLRAIASFIIKRDK